MKKILIPILLIISIYILLFGCKNKKELFTSYLTNDSCKFWYEYKIDDSIVIDLKRNNSPAYWICFDISGWFSNFRYNGNNLKLIQLPPDIDPLQWKLINESHIRIGSGDFYIMKLTKDTLKLIETITNKKYIYIKTKGKY